MTAENNGAQPAYIVFERCGEKLVVGEGNERVSMGPYMHFFLLLTFTSMMDTAKGLSLQLAITKRHHKTVHSVDMGTIQRLQTFHATCLRPLIADSIAFLGTSTQIYVGLEIFK